MLKYLSGHFHLHVKSILSNKTICANFNLETYCFRIILHILPSNLRYTDLDVRIEFQSEHYRQLLSDSTMIL